jgi:biopolymer transport protein ExbB/TolQ
MARDYDEVKPATYSSIDIEQRFGFRGGRFTSVSSLLTFVLGAILTCCFYLALVPFEGFYFAEMFTQRGVIPYFIVFLSGWCLAIIFVKSRKVALQRKSLRIDVVPKEGDFILSTSTAGQVLDRIYQQVDEPRQFVLFNRILVALSNLRNLGRVTDVDEVLQSHADNDYATMETSYSLLRGFIWAIPVLGFIGTVLGLSRAVGGFGKVLSETSDVSEIASSLTVVTSGLAVAFETTLEALVAALVIQLLATFLRKNEEDFLNRCTEYCTARIVGRLRTMPYDNQASQPTISEPASS